MSAAVTHLEPLDEVDARLLDAMREYVASFAARQPVRQVAVVGNAPLAPSEERRCAVDGADLVVRCNSFALDEPGDDPCLGTRTDVVVAARQVRPTPWFFQDYRSRVYLLMDAGSVRRRTPKELPASWPDDLGLWLIPNRLFGLPLRRAIRPETDGAGAVPTTGTMAAYLARTLFPEAETLLTGFSFLENREQTAWEHHWGDSSPVHPAHKLDREGALLQSWVDQGLARHLP